MSCWISNTTDSLASPEGYRRSLHVAVLGTVATLLIAFTSIVGNSAVVAVSYWYETLRMQTANLMIVYLALTDIATALFVMLPSAAAVATDAWPLGNTFCKANAALNYTLFCSSSFNISLISVDRVIAVLFPFKYSVWMTARMMTGFCVILFSQSLIFGLIVATPDWITYDYREGVCAVNYYYSNANLQWLTLVASITCTFFPAVVMGVCNAIIIVTANRSKQRVQNLFVKRSELSREAHMRKTIKSLLVVVLTYYICYTPYSLTKQVKIHAGCEAPGWFDYLTQIIVFVASATNPFIYAIFRKDYREGFKKFFGLLARKIFQF